jgi:hypothetical protein
LYRLSVFLFAALISESAGRLARRLAGRLAFAATGLLVLFIELAANYCFYMFHAETSKIKPR